MIKNHSVRSSRSPYSAMTVFPIIPQMFCAVSSGENAVYDLTIKLVMCFKPITFAPKA